MTHQEQAAVNALCMRIVEERNPVQFTKLVDQLNELLEAKQNRLDLLPSSDKTRN